MEIMTEPQIIRRFADLFVGRIDAYGTDEGGARWREVLPITYERHLNGVEPIGIYPVTHNTVRWGCCDIDTGDWTEAFLLTTALQGMGFKPHVERSRSKGWHIWIFVNEWVTAAEMRRALKVAYAAIDLPAKEANPKSENLRPEQLGNYVRLPYKGAFVIKNERQCFTRNYSSQQDGIPVSLYDWISQPDSMIYTNPELVKRWASKWYEPNRRTIELAVDPDVDTVSLAATLPSTWRKVWLDGEVRDRSATFVAMAYDLAKRGWQPQQVFDILWFCPWNKYRDRVNGDKYVQDIVERAFS